MFYRLYPRTNLEWHVKIQTFGKWSLGTSASYQVIIAVGNLSWHVVRNCYLTTRVTRTSSQSSYGSYGQNKPRQYHSWLDHFLHPISQNQWCFPAVWMVLHGDFRCINQGSASTSALQQRQGLVSSTGNMEIWQKDLTAKLQIQVKHVFKSSLSCQI